MELNKQRRQTNPPARFCACLVHVAELTTIKVLELELIF